jgi:hypothetical protein
LRVYDWLERVADLFALLHIIEEPDLGLELAVGSWIRFTLDQHHATSDRVSLTTDVVGKVQPLKGDRTDLPTLRGFDLDPVALHVLDLDRVEGALLIRTDLKNLFFFDGSLNHGAPQDLDTV